MAACLTFDVDHYQAVSDIRPLDWPPSRNYANSIFSSGAHENMKVVG